MIRVNSPPWPLLKDAAPTEKEKAIGIALQQLQYREGTKGIEKVEKALEILWNRAYDKGLQDMDRMHATVNSKKDNQ